MLFCDLIVNGAEIWTGVPCLSGVEINSLPYAGFSGSLVFVDTMGYTNPEYAGLADRYVLIFTPPGSSITSQIPLQAIPSQQQSIILDSQNCVLSIYDKDLNPDILETSYVVIEAPESGIMGMTLTATAFPAMLTYLWSISNGTILSGQGTSSITYIALSVAPVVLTLLSDLPQGGTTTATATTTIYDVSMFAISSREYVWAGEFDVPVSVPFPGTGFNWSIAGSLKLSGSHTAPGTTIDAGRASQPASISTVIGGLTMTTWNFKIVPYTSSLSFSTGSLAASASAASVQDLGWAYTLESITVDAQCWVRIYNSQADLDADAGRVIGDDPSSPIVIDVIFAAPGTVAVDPVTKGLNPENPRLKSAYISVTNTGAITAAINVSILRTETQVNGLV